MPTTGSRVLAMGRKISVAQQFSDVVITIACPNEDEAALSFTAICDAIRDGRKLTLSFDGSPDKEWGSP